MLIANAVLDLVDVPAILPGLLRLLVPGGVYWFTINYDGESIFAPGHPHDDQVMQAYHRDMDERVRYGRPAGDSRTGRRLFHYLRAAGAPALAAGSSDWVVSAGPDGNYPDDEAYFLRSILSTIQDALRSRPDRVEPADLADWLAVRGRQLAAGELVYIAHHQPFSERGGEGSRIAGRDQLAGAGAIGGGAERFGQPTDGGSYDGQAVGERFGDGHAVGLRAGRRDEQVGGGVRVAERRAGQDAGEPDAVAVAEARDAGLQLVDEVRVAVERSGQHAMPVPLSEVGERLDEEVLPLVAAEDSDADQVAADGPGRGSDPIDAGPGDVHPVGRDRVSGQDLLAGPFAGNDHAGGRAEHDPFGALRAGIMVCVEGGGQWHVQQHCHSYPAGVWQQLRGGRRGDEPVDQDGLTVGDGGNDAGQVGAGARAGIPATPRRRS